MSEIFEMPVSESPRIKWQKRVTAELGIFTNHAPGMGWMAFSHKKSIELLEGYGLSAGEKENPMELFAGYCRLLDEAHQLADKEPTEFDAICAVCKIHGIPFWNEENFRHVAGE